MIIRHVKFTTATDLCEGRSGGGNAEEITAARLRLANACFEADRNPGLETSKRAADARQFLNNLLGGP
jgi:hypothetical protein